MTKTMSIGYYLCAIISGIMTIIKSAIKIFAIA